MLTSTGIPTSATRGSVRQARREPGPASAAGLCGICRNAASCAFPRVPGAIIQHCDEATLPVREVPSPFGHRSAPFVRESMEPAVRGLCSNCENRDGCTLRKPEGGVWRCEEYA